MTLKNKALTAFALLLCLNISANFVLAEELSAQVTKFPDYSEEFLGKDKCENFNRRMFIFNSKLNKFLIKPVHIVWSSIMPKYGMDRIQSLHTNIVYPRRLVSSLIQKDFKSSGRETVRFLTNTTLGLGGLYDPAKSLFKLEPVDEDMEQALAKCHVKQGPYLVIPVLSSSSPRDLAGRVLDWALDPSSYIATPVLAIVKAGLVVNRTSYMQPLVKMLESTYADPYEIAKKLYGLENHIKVSNLDRAELLQNSLIPEEPAEELSQDVENFQLASLEEDLMSGGSYYKKPSFEIQVADLFRGGASTDEIILKDKEPEKSSLIPDLILGDYNPQNPVTDSMRTALFELPGINDSIWTELSVWNRCFAKRIKTSSINVDKDREDYKFRFILQKDKNSPVVIIYPSIGEGINCHHSVVLAKLFYDEGYSVIIQGSSFHWEFAKSMPKGYAPGHPVKDAKYLKLVTGKILAKLESKYNCKFENKTLIGTSFGALTTLFIADSESKENTLGIDKFISVNPPISLIYAMNQIDRNTAEWNKNPNDLKNRVAATAAKVIQLVQLKDTPDFKIERLPFSSDESKLITGFIMHQKLSDLIFTLENAPKCKKCEFYQNTNNMDYSDYAKKYLMNEGQNEIADLDYETSLKSINSYLKSGTNFRIYHTIDDYLVNTKQLAALKRWTGNKTILISNGGHLGFMYRPEFLESLHNDITLEPNKTALLTKD